MAVDPPHFWKKKKTNGMGHQDDFGKQNKM
jgi:hypothetical protein